MTNHRSSDEFYYIHYARAGSGNPVLLLHGLGASHFDWDLLGPELVSAGYQTIAPDLPGHGESYKPRRGEMYHVENVFDTFVEWIDSLELGQPLTLVGHSLGGYLAIEYALRHPDDVRGLVLIAPFYTQRQLSYLVRAGLTEERINALALNRVPAWLYAALVDLASFTLIEGQGLRHELPKDIRRQTVKDYQRTAPGAFHLPFTARSLEPYLDRIAVPTLLIYGQRDRTLNPRLYPPLAELLPGSRQLSLNAGHVLHQSHAATVNPEILGFLEELK
jgi:pimeloyl-ACP methyl ester carboxylesterase